MQNIFKKAQQLSWMPDADPTNAPEGAALRADNLVDDELGTLSLRLGSSVMHEDLEDDVHSIRTATLADGNNHQIVGAGDRLYDNGEDFGVEFDDEGDIALGDDTYQAFAARGLTKKKFDGSTLNEWGIAAPELAPTIEASIAVTDEVASFNDDEDPAFNVNEGTSDFVNSYELSIVSSSVANPTVITTAAAHKLTSGDSVVITGHEDSTPSIDGTHVVTVTSTTTFTIAVNVSDAGTGGTMSRVDGALSLIPDAGTGRASASKKFESDQDFFNIFGSLGSDTDLFDFRVWLQDPRKVDKITVMFGLGTGEDPFLDDYYYFDFPIKNAQTVNVKDGGSATVQAYKLSAQNVTTSLSPSEITSIRSPQEAADVLTRLGRYGGPRSRERQDSQEASPAWGHLSVTRGQFNRVGGTADRNWQTVRGFKIVYTTVPGSTEVVYLDDAVWTGGGDLALTGTFTFAYRFVRDNGTYIEMSPISPVSDPITLNQQACEITIPAQALSGADPQVNQVWIYMNGGFLDTYYRVAITGSTNNSSSMKMDEFAQTADGSFDAADRTRLVNQGLSIPGFTADASIILTLQTNDVQALLQNESLEPGAVGPPDHIKAIAGPWNNRVFVITTDGWLYPSLQTSPSNFSVYHTIDLRRYGTPLWMAETNGGILVGMTKDVIRIAGTGDESADKVTADLYPEPMNVGNPPVDETFFTDGNAIVYRAADGLMSLTGANLIALSQGQTSLLWRGKNRHGVSPLNLTSGRFRLAVDDHILYMLAPEGTSEDLSDGSSSAVWRYNLKKQTWARTYYPWVLRSIHREPGGNLVAGTNEGTVVLLESGSNDDGESIPINLLLPFNDGGNPLIQKVPHDLQVHCNTGGSSGTAALLLDGATSPEATTYSFVSSGAGVYRADLSDVAVFIRVQVRLTGEFQTFVFHGVNVSYRPRPQQAMALDTGYITAGDKDLVWMQEAEIDCISPSDLQLAIYLDDTLHDTLDVAVTPNKRSVYRVPLPRGSKARRPRLLITTTASDNEGSVGFECYGVRVRVRGSGNQTDNGMVTVFPAGQAQ